MRQPVDAFDYEKQLIYGADYKDHLHEINNHFFFWGCFILSGHNPLVVSLK